MDLSWIQLGSLLTLLGVTLGTFSTHSIEKKLSKNFITFFKTGVLYHIIHSFALFIIAWLSTLTHDPAVQYAGLFFMIGILLFSGFSYILAITETEGFRWITLIGALFFLAGWFLLLHGNYTNFH
ncbi:MAG: DUF423 domain-containing protein [Candidatus Omnitrophica bacterium]|nr:DUF423 domain-containing protein [Candidatus Omnitrophota bacterium]